MSRSEAAARGFQPIDPNQAFQQLIQVSGLETDQMADVSKLTTGLDEALLSSDSAGQLISSGKPARWKAGKRSRIRKAVTPQCRFRSADRADVRSLSPRFEIDAQVLGWWTILNLNS